MTTTANVMLENCCDPCPSCGSGCENDCPVNIQSANPDCLRVDTSECGVIKLEPVCPPVVEAGENVTVDVEDCEDEKCSKKYIVNAVCEDEKVKTCDNDASAGYLEDKIKARDGSGIVVNAIGCDSSDTDAYLELSIDSDKLPKGPNDKVSVQAGCEAKYLNDAIKIDSRLIKSSIEDCQLVLSDNFAYRKIYLQTDIIKNNIPTGQTPSFLFTGSTTSWNTVETAGGVKVAKNVDFENGVMKIKIPGIYYVGFSGTMEIGSGIHAMRAQLYRTDSEAEAEDAKRYTIIESRYSAPVGWPPYESGGTPSGFNLDTPYRQLKTDVEGVIAPGDGYSASLGSYISRMPVGGDTIEILNEGDRIMFGAKASTQVDYHGDQMTQSDKTGHFAFLCRGSSRSGGIDIGGEPGLTIFVALLAPL